MLLSKAIVQELPLINKMAYICLLICMQYVQRNSLNTKVQQKNMSIIYLSIENFCYVTLDYIRSVC